MHLRTNRLSIAYVRAFYYKKFIANFVIVYEALLLFIFEFILIFST